MNNMKWKLKTIIRCWLKVIKNGIVYLPGGYIFSFEQLFYSAWDYFSCRFWTAGLQGGSNGVDSRSSRMLFYIWDWYFWIIIYKNCKIQKKIFNFKFLKIRFQIFENRSYSKKLCSSFFLVMAVKYDCSFPNKSLLQVLLYYFIHLYYY